MASDQLSVPQAARLIFPAGNGAPQHVQAVEQWLASGTLAGTRSRRTGEWTTNRAAVAEFLAEAASQRAQERTAGRGARNPVIAPATSVTARSKPQTAGDVYKDVWREFFLSVLGRRSSARRNDWFQAAVLGVQALVVMAVVVGCVLAMSGGSLTAEQAAVARWIEGEFGPHDIVQWHPPTSDASDGQRLRVEFSYYSVGRQQVRTDRTFRVRGDQVQPLSQPADD